MAKNVLDTGMVSFTSQGRLLEELGLRLVASPEIALVELIKNAYDADSPDCEVRFTEDGNALVVTDHGHGMTLNDFKNQWMQIATGNKLSEHLSPRYKRLLTGAKGIGRFAIRYLGDHLALESTAFDKKRGQLTTLRASFDWPDVDKTSDLSQARIPYQHFAAKANATTGTSLTIGKLRADASFTTSRNFRSNVLKIVSPLHGLDDGSFHGDASRGASDPGFKVILPGDEPTSDTNLADLVLRNAWARLTISLKGSELVIQVSFPEQKKPRVLRVRTSTTIKKGLFADIRFFPRRKGVFENKEVDGKMAWQWVRDNSGVAVIDHGFRIKPYGYPDDDWLNLDVDTAHNRRDWRSGISERHFPIAPQIKLDPAVNPALNLPYNLQLVGAVFVETNRKPNPDEAGDLISSMDREGLLGNCGFAELKEYVRTGIEFLAHCDKEELSRLAVAEAKRAAESARADIQKAISNIQESPTLTPGDKTRIVKNYSALAERLDEQEEYASRSRQTLMTMSLLGVVAGFMTHESDAMLHDLEQATRQIERVTAQVPELKETSKELSRRLETFRGFVEYSKLFIKKAAPDDLKPFSAAGQVRFVIGRFKAFAEDRSIDVRCEIGRDVMTPAIPVSAYSGVLLNLYTNALKAILSVSASVPKPQIVFRGWNENANHVVEVLDNGAGVPVELRKRIWDPLYTTTAYPENPLGPGMGLGLTLVRQVVRELGGNVALMPNAPAGFSSCFRVTFPIR